jgi:hypothetical protein
MRSRRAWTLTRRLSLCRKTDIDGCHVRKDKGGMLGSLRKVRTTPLCLCIFRLLPCLILLIARVNGSDIIWRPQTRLSSSLRLPCSQHHYPCRVYDVKFCAARKHTYLSAAAWDNAAHVWGLSGCPPRQANCYFEMYTSSASRGEVCLISSSCLVLVLAVTKLSDVAIGEQSLLYVFCCLVTHDVRPKLPRSVTSSIGPPIAVLWHPSTARVQCVCFILTTAEPFCFTRVPGTRAQ